MPPRSTILLRTTLGLLAIAVACTGDGPAEVPVEVTATLSGAEATPVATAAPPVALTPGTPSPESLDAALAALIGSMEGGGVDPFGGPPESLPPELRALLEALGIDLLLGTAVSEIGGVLVVEAVFAGRPPSARGCASAMWLPRSTARRLTRPPSCEARWRRSCPGTPTR